MKWFRLIAPMAGSGQASCGFSAAISDPVPITPEGGSGDGSAGGVVKLTASLPPVLRPMEPAESRRLVLPGPPKPGKPASTATAAPTGMVPNVKPVVPVAKMAVLPTKLVPDPILRQPLPRLPVAAPPPPPVKPAMPPDLEREIALYCQKQIGHWKKADARGVLGTPHPAGAFCSMTRNAPSMRTVMPSGSDPTGRYKDMELDFDRESRALLCEPCSFTPPT